MKTRRDVAEKILVDNLFASLEGWIYESHPHRTHLT